MIKVRKAKDRGHFPPEADPPPKNNLAGNQHWLDSWHTFSFDTYHDPDFMGFRSLRVINEDRVAPGAGFPTHAHRDMEIVTYILEGELEHKDSMGNGTVIRPGEVQRMTAGTGVQHSEFNRSKKDAVHLLQIWILPEKKGLTPGYEQKDFSAQLKKGGFLPVATKSGDKGSVTVHQDVKLLAGTLAKGTKQKVALDAGRYAWVQVARGAVKLNGIALDTSDGAAVSGERELEIAAEKDSEILLFDLA